MTSKNSSKRFFKLFRSAYLPAAAAMTVMCTVTFLAYLLNYSGTGYSLFNPFEDFIYIFMFSAFCVLSGAFAFGTTALKRPANVYLSLGVSRRKQFCARWLGGLVAVVSAVLFVVLLLFVSGIRSHEKEMGYTALVAVLFLTGGFAVIYSITALVYSCGDNIFESAVLAFAIFMCLLLSDEFFTAGQSLRFGATYDAGYSGLQTRMELPSSFSLYQVICPFFGLLNFSSLGYGDKALVAVNLQNGIYAALSCLCYIVILFLLSFFGFQKKSAENFGKLFKASYLYRIVGVLLSLTVFRISLITLELKRVPLCIVSVLLAVVCNLLVNAIFVRRFPEKTTPAVVIVTALFCILCCNSDNKLPDASQVKNVTVFSQFGYTLDFSDENLVDIRSYGFESKPSGKYTYYSENDLAQIRSLHEKIYDDGYLTSVYPDVYDTVFEFCYTMKDGSKKYYSYRAISTDILTDINGLEKTESAQNLYDRLNIQSIVDVQDRNMKIIGKISDSEGLLDALRKDILTRDSSKIYNHPASEEIAVLTVNNNNNRVLVAAHNMFSDLIKNTPDWSSGYEFCDFDTFYTFYDELTAGNLYHTDNCGIVYSESFDCSITGDKKMILLDGYNEPIVVAAAEYYNALSDVTQTEINKMAESISPVYSEEGFNIVVTADMTATAEFLEKNLISFEEKSPEIKYVAVFDRNFYGYYAYKECFVTHVSETVEDGIDMSDYWYYDEYQLTRTEDSSIINAVLDASSVCCGPDSSPYAALFVSENTVFTKFIGQEDYEAIMQEYSSVLVSDTAISEETEYRNESPKNEENYSTVALYN